ncbi:MAG: MerR family transcriptional regulator [Alphaproteobacteria bacterium]|nr:MerR family transcriptional regulator [Alphaproteobacteria bacterium]
MNDTNPRPPATPQGPERSFSIEELASLAGVTRRSVRFYIQSGLLDPPEGTARGAYYTSRHLQRLLDIQAWQDEGLTLDGIRRRLAATATDAAAPEAARPRAPVQVWTRIALRPGVEVHLDPEAAGLSPEQVRELAAGLRALLDRIAGKDPAP